VKWQEDRGTLEIRQGSGKGCMNGPQKWGAGMDPVERGRAWVVDKGMEGPTAS
jgi:hypothetical protein